MDENVSLSAAVAACAQRFELRDGRPILDAPGFAATWQQLSALPADHRESTATELIALARKFQRMVGPPAAEAIAQLFVLAAGLLEDEARAQRLFAQQGVDLRDSARFIGAAAQNTPAGSGRISEGKNLAALILKSHRGTKS
jgi:hypothetical protein